MTECCPNHAEAYVDRDRGGPVFVEGRSPPATVVVGARRYCTSCAASMTAFVARQPVVVVVTQ